MAASDTVLEQSGLKAFGLHCVRKQASDTFVVFVHGILSDGDGAWGKPSWPELLKAENDFQKMGIYIFTYRTSVSSRTYSIADAAAALREHLAIEGLLDLRNIIFVCHSLGGIVVRRFLVSSQARLTDLGPNIGLFLVASPSRGSRDANLATLLSFAMQHTQAAVLRFSQTNTSLNDLHDDFQTLLNSGKVRIIGRELLEDKTIQVKRWIGLRRQVVEPFSASAYFHQPGFEPLKIPGSDHASIVKPLDASKLQHRILKKFLSDFEKLADVIHPAQQQATESSKDNPLESKIPGDKSTDRPALQTRLGPKIAEIPSAAQPPSLPTSNAESEDQHGPFSLDGLVGVPELTRKMLPRSELVGDVVNAILNSQVSGERFFFLAGPGGCGKSTTAALVARAPELRAAFPDGIFWVSIGQQPDISSRQAAFLNLTPNRPSSFPTAEAATIHLRNFFKNKKSLIVLDDVWELSDLQAFQVGGEDCRTILTGREMKLAWPLDAVTFAVRSLSPAEASELLSIRAGGDFHGGPDITSLAQALDFLPLALELAAYQLKFGVTARKLLEQLNSEQSRLQALDIPGYEHEKNEEVARNLSLNACINLSLRRLSPDLLLQFAQLSILQPSSTFNALVVKNVCALADEMNADGVLRTLRSMSLIEQVSIPSENRRADYRMHSVMRAKAIAVLSTKFSLAEPLGLDQSPKHVLAAFLHRVNPNYPNYWHLIPDDQHTIEYLTDYLIRLGEQGCLQSILHTRADGSDVYSPNAWHSLKSARSQEDSFRADIQKIYEEAISWDCRELPSFDILVRSFLGTVSINEMNKSIDAQTCVNLVKTGLWSEGLALSHARLHFGLSGIAEVASHLSEPLKSTAIEQAIRIAESSLMQAGTASAFVRCALIWEGPMRSLLVDACTRLLHQHLSTSRNLWDGKVGTNALRASIDLANNAKPPNWSPDSYLTKFVEGGKRWRLPPQQEIGDLEITYLPSIVALETLLHLALDATFNLRSRALEALSSLQSELIQREDYCVFAFKLKVYCDLSTIGVDWNTVCLKALSSPYTSAYAKMNFEHALGESEGIAGFSKAILAEYRNDPAVLSSLLSGATSSPARLSLLEHICADDGISVSQLILMLGSHAWLADSFGNQGRIAPVGNGIFRADQEYRVILRTMMRHKAPASVDQQNLCADICRISNDADRVDVIEITLSYLKDLRITDAEAICSSFSNLERRALAQLMIGTQVERFHQREFLLAAIASFRDAKSSVVALQALGIYVGYYGNHAAETVRAAAAFAEGIGDTEELRIAFARAAINLGAEATSSFLRATFWRVADSFPVEAPPIPIPIIRSLCCLPFWHSAFPRKKTGAPGPVRLHDKRPWMMASKNSNEEFLNFTIAHLSTIPEDTTRVEIYEQLADIAQECTMRGLVGYAGIIVSAMYETAIMFR
ncbi:alpha/beta fold hydrolase [Bradyrhizobium sp. WU425]|uniref:alpha/beta fold hydrolase n=1 Tax=Bradyrhizobium sp. WU425 TaxID=187029 RepID=UPI001E55D338|nr:alpha/beta fold hydrolase [Bradyrhizobium canariense]UFW69197.1 alpha/beta fold hydrolase [Bradyrhizobium canariense]